MYKNSKCFEEVEQKWNISNEKIEKCWKYEMCLTIVKSDENFEKCLKDRKKI